MAPSEKAMECFPSNPGCFVQVHSDPAHRGDGVWPGSLGWGREAQPSWLLKQLQPPNATSHLTRRGQDIPGHQHPQRPRSGCSWTILPSNPCSARWVQGWAPDPNPTRRPVQPDLGASLQWAPRCFLKRCTSWKMQTKNTASQSRFTKIITFS